jgi:hypothetical protein
VACARPTSPTGEPADGTVALVDAALVTSGRVLSGLAVEGDGRSRSWWWPALAASQRALVAGLVPDGSADARRRVASRLAEAVNGMVREQLASEKVALVPAAVVERTNPQISTRHVLRIQAGEQREPADRVAHPGVAEVDQLR